MKQGDLVIVRGYGGTPLLRRVWEDFADSAVAIHDDENYERHLQGLQCLDPVWFKRSSVFAYDSATFPTAALGVPQDATFWDGLTRA